jgi:hypothetical protein
MSQLTKQQRRKKKLAQRPKTTKKKKEITDINESSKSLYRRKKYLSVR